MGQNRRRGGPWSERRVIAVGRPAPRTAVAVLRPLRADRTRRESPARTVSRGGDSGGGGDSSDSDGDSEPPGVERGRGPRHIGPVLADWLAWSLPDSYSFAEHRRRYGHLSPSGQLAAFLTLPEWQCQEAWRSLRFDIDRERGPPAVTSVRP